MAEDYHVLAVSPNGRSATVVFHIPIPIESNSASVDLRTALVEFQGTVTSKLANIDAGELTQLQAGELYEVVETVKFLAADTNLQKQTKIDNRYTLLTTSVLTKVRAILKFWGLNRDVI